MKRRNGAAAVEGFTAKGTTFADTKIPLGPDPVDLQPIIDSGEESSDPLNKKTRRRAEVKKRSKERSRSNPPTEEVVRHQRDPLMSQQTQELVKVWIKESLEKKLAISNGVILSEVPRNDPKEVSKEGPTAASKVEDLTSESLSIVMTKVSGPEKLQVRDASFKCPGMRSAKKLAKLEAKIIYSKKSKAGTSIHVGGHVRQDKQVVVSRNSQVCRGEASVVPGKL